MKKNFIIISLCFITICIAFITITLAKNPSILSKSILNNTSEKYVETTNKNPTKTSKVQALSIANDLLSKYNIGVKLDKIQNFTLKEFNNNLLNRNETCIYTESFIVQYNSDTKDLIAYISNETSFKTNTLSRDMVSLIAKDLFHSIKSDKYQDYEMIFLEKFDQQLYRVKFAKKYNNLINEGESINFSFSPEENKIVTLALNSYPYANNETLISEKEALNIAKSFNKAFEGDKVTISIKIVMPNYNYEKALDKNKIYKTVTTMRKAYVIATNDKRQTDIFIDCTTGEIIGGSQNL